jgi:hypothetical protein
MRLPRDFSGDQLAILLRRYGYEVTRQTGSHMRLTTTQEGEQHVTIPRLFLILDLRRNDRARWLISRLMTRASWWRSLAGGLLWWSSPVPVDQQEGCRQQQG